MAYACSGVRIMASYPLLVLQRAKGIGLDSQLLEINLYR